MRLRLAKAKRPDCPAKVDNQYLCDRRDICKTIPLHRVRSSRKIKNCDARLLKIDRFTHPGRKAQTGPLLDWRRQRESECAAREK